MSLLFSIVLGLFWLNPKIIIAVKNYVGYKVYNLTLETEAQREFLKTYVDSEGYSFWLLPIQGFTHVMVSPSQHFTFENALKNHNITSYNFIHENVGEAIKHEQSTRITVQKTSSNDIFDFDHFPRYQEIVNFMKTLVKKKKYSKLITIGRSYEGRTIYAVEVKKSSEKPVFLLDAGIHAKEWAAPISAMYILKNLIDNEDRFVELMNFVIIPCLNPDGYEYTHTDDRLWRKSRSDNPNSKCKGVDLNRNFDFHWEEGTFEKDPCSCRFQGNKPFSESESVALRDTILKYKPVAYLTLHAYGAMILYPWGYSKDLPDNWKTLNEIAKKASFRMEQINGTKYVYGSSGRLIYKAPGASDDWSMANGVSIVYTLELPEYNSGSFIVPTEMITPLLKEAFQGFSSMVASVAAMK